MREAYKGTSSIENGGRKSPIKIEIRKDFYLIIVLFTVFIRIWDGFLLFQDFFGLAKCDSPLAFQSLDFIMFQGLAEVSREKSLECLAVTGFVASHFVSSVPISSSPFIWLQRRNFWCVNNIKNQLSA